MARVRYVVGTYDIQTTPGKKSTYVLVPLKGQKQIVRCLYLSEKNKTYFQFLHWVEIGASSFSKL